MQKETTTYKIDNKCKGSSYMYMLVNVEPNFACKPQSLFLTPCRRESGELTRRRINFIIKTRSIFF